ncbi:MAG: DUF1003 domain-containing protein [Desulfitobacteriaceae bacterium]
MPDRKNRPLLDKDNSRRVGRLVDQYEHQILAHLNEDYARDTKWPDRLADKMASFGGSWKFIIFFCVFLFLWIVWNVVGFTKHFDNPPYILLNLILSFLASFQAPIIMMSQNRQAVRDKHEAVIDFSINYKAELEIDDMQSHLHHLEGKISEIKLLLETLTKGNTLK